MSTIEPKKIEGTPEEMKNILLQDCKRMFWPYLLTYVSFYFLFIFASFACFYKWIPHNSLGFTVFLLFSFISTGFFHLSHGLAAEAIEQGHRTFFGVIAYIFKNRSEIKTIVKYYSKHVDFYLGMFIALMLALIYNTGKPPENDVSSEIIHFYGTILIWMNGFALLPFGGLRFLIFRKITQDTPMARVFERMAFYLNRSLFNRYNLIMWRFSYLLLVISFPIFAIITEPFLALFGYVFYKHVFDDGLKMKQKVVEKYVVTVPKMRHASGFS